MRFYLASRFSRAPEMRVIRTRMLDCGVEVTSTWIDQEENVDDCGTEQATLIAQRDILDIERADSILLWGENGRVLSRGGRLFEFGYSYATGHRCFVLNYRDQVFSALPRVEFFGSFQDFDDAILKPLKQEPRHDA